MFLASYVMQIYHMKYIHNTFVNTFIAMTTRRITPTLRVQAERRPPPRTPRTPRTTRTAVMRFHWAKWILKPRKIWVIPILRNHNLGRHLLFEHLFEPLRIHPRKTKPEVNLLDMTVVSKPPPAAVPGYFAVPASVVVHPVLRIRRRGMDRCNFLCCVLHCVIDR
jgi:hypothetical protein